LQLRGKLQLISRERNSLAELILIRANLNTSLRFSAIDFNRTHSSSARTARVSARLANAFAIAF